MAARELSSLPQVAGATERKELKMRTVSVLSICLLLTVPAAAESLTEKTGINSLIGRAPSTQDFVTEAGISDMFEIQSSKLALQKTNDDAIKAFASQMVTDHGKTTAEVESLVDSGKVNAKPPQALDDSHQSMLDKLKSLDGGDFRKQYLDDQVKGHKDAVDLFKRYGNNGQNADLKAFAQKTLPTIEHHLDMAQNLDK
jgi:putative membrane protein